MDSQQEKIRQEILTKLSNTETLNSEDLAKEFKVDHQIIVGIIKSLEIKEIIAISKLEKKEISLIENGKNCIEKGSPNLQILKELKSGPKTKKELNDLLGKEIFSHGFSMAMKSKEISYDKKLIWLVQTFLNFQQTMNLKKNYFKCKKKLTLKNMTKNF